ncbi:MAG: hypothetical protein ACYTGW_09760 [Planctomycetota bacterium]|jgi:hypothetical protein
MALTHLLLVLPLLQQPGSGDDPAPGEVGKFRWPPTVQRTLQYKATLTKERKLPPDLLRAEKAARKEARLYAPRRPPRQRVEMSMDIQLKVNKDTVDATYTTSLDKQSLRLEVLKPKKTRARPKDAAAPPPKDVPFLGNDKIPAVWGPPASKADKKLQVPLAALARQFHHMFRKAGQKGTAPEDLRIRFGDHLLPVVWTYPLPCWIGDLVSTMDLGGEAVIGGKRLIRDGSQFMKLGCRNVRVDAIWTQASAANFTLNYKLSVEQFISETRDGKPIQGRTTMWLFDIDGVGKYSFQDQAWDSIVENVRGRLKEIPDAKMKALHDEIFVGTIKIHRVGTAGGKKRRQGRR